MIISMPGVFQQLFLAQYKLSFDKNFTLQIGQIKKNIYIYILNSVLLIDMERNRHPGCRVSFTDHQPQLKVYLNNFYGLHLFGSDKLGNFARRHVILRTRQNLLLHF